MFYLLFCIFREREKDGERDGKKHQYVVASSEPPYLVRNPGMCPDWELSQRSFGWQAGAQSIEPHQPGLFFYLSCSSLTPAPAQHTFCLSYSRHYVFPYCLLDSQALWGSPFKAVLSLIFFISFLPLKHICPMAYFLLALLYTSPISPLCPLPSSPHTSHLHHIVVCIHRLCIYVLWLISSLRNC